MAFPPARRCVKNVSQSRSPHLSPASIEAFYQPGARSRDAAAARMGRRKEASLSPPRFSLHLPRSSIHRLRFPAAFTPPSFLFSSPAPWPFVIPEHLHLALFFFSLPLPLPSTDGPDSSFLPPHLRPFRLLHDKREGGRRRRRRRGAGPPAHEKCSCPKATGCPTNIIPLIPKYFSRL